MIRSLLLSLALLLFLLPLTAHADDARRAGELQGQAEDAYGAGDLDRALRLAQQAILLNSGPGTWLAQQLRVEILEKQGQIREALRYLDDYMALDGLFPEHVAWGREARGRLEGRLIVLQSREQERLRDAQVRRGVGIGALVGGAVPLATGIGFLANFGRLGGGGSYAGWGQSGGALLVVGAVAEAVGAVLVASAGAPKGIVLAPAPLPGGGAIVLSISLPPALSAGR